jgi:hypothetical protein
LNGERRAHKEYQWTNSGLFVKLADVEGIIKPISGLKEHLEPYIEETRDAFQRENGISIDEKARNAATDNDEGKKHLDELFYSWIARFLDPFISTKALTLYEWPVACAPHDEKHSNICQELALGDLTWLEEGGRGLSTPTPHIPLTKSMGALDSLHTFKETQQFEANYLPALRIGQLSQDEYLKLLEPNYPKYKKVDEELSAGLDKRLYHLLRIRDRFRGKRGWELVQGYLEIARDTSVDQRGKLQNAIRNIVLDCVNEENVHVASLDTPTIIDPSFPTGRAEFASKVTESRKEATFTTVSSATVSTRTAVDLGKREIAEQQLSPLKSATIYVSGWSSQPETTDMTGSPTKGPVMSPRKDIEVQPREQFSEASEPETTFGFHDFHELPLAGKDPEELEREFGVKIKILDKKKDKLLNAYAIRVSGSDDAVDAFLEMFDLL